MAEDYLAGLNDLTSSMGNEDTASEDFQGSGQKGLDYSQLENQVVKFVAAADRQQNKFDVIPFIITQQWYEKLLFPPPTQAQREAGQKYARPRNRKVGQADICLEIPFHRFADGDSGDAVCLREAFGEKCPHCEEMFELYKKQDKDNAKQLSPSWRTFFNIYNYLTASGDENGHDGYEVIDDMGRGALMKYIQLCSKNTQLGENFVYPWGDPTENGYILVAPSIYKPPTSKKYSKGYTEFPVITFEKRAEGVNYVEDIKYSVSFDELVTPLIFSYEEMQEMLKKKLAKMGVEQTEPEESYDTDQSGNNSSYAGTPEGNGTVHRINEFDSEPPAYSEAPEKRGRVGRRDRNASSNEQAGVGEPPSQNDAPPQASEPTTRRRRR